jgi:hypothetical protein
MAVLAGYPELPPVHIGVAVCASGAHFRKFQTLVTANAVNKLMGAKK